MVGGYTRNYIIKEKGLPPPRLPHPILSIKKQQTRNMILARFVGVRIPSRFSHTNRMFSTWGEKFKAPREIPYRKLTVGAFCLPFISVKLSHLLQVFDTDIPRDGIKYKLLTPREIQSFWQKGRTTGKSKMCR